MTKKQVVYSLFFYFISAFGISLTVKAAVGVSSFNSLNVILGTLFTIKLGTITTIINLLFLLACYLLDNNNTIKEYLLMLVALLSFGGVINLILYYLLPHLIVGNYFFRVLLFISGTLIAGFGTGQVLRFDLLKFPIENFCTLLSERTNQSFSRYRYSIDIICVTNSLLLSTLFGLPIVVREGTLISLFLLSATISWSKTYSPSITNTSGSV